MTLRFKWGLKVNEILTKKINELTLISQLYLGNRKSKRKILKNLLVDRSIDGTKEYIAEKDEFTLNAALIINKKPVIGLVGHQKTVYFILLVQTKAFLLKITTQKKLNKKLSSKNEIVALSSVHKPDLILIN